MDTNLDRDTNRFMMLKGEDIDKDKRSSGRFNDSVTLSQSCLMSIVFLCNILKIGLSSLSQSY